MPRSLVYSRPVKDHPGQFGVHCRHEDCVGDETDPSGRLITIAFLYGGRGAITEHLATHGGVPNIAP